MAKLAALLDKEASAEIDAILSEARSRASEITAAAEEEAKNTLAQREKVLAQQHEAALVRARSAAQLEAASMRLRAQHEAVESVFAQVRRDIAALVKDKKRYRPVLAELIKAAADGVGSSGNLIVTVHPDEADVAEAALTDLGYTAKVEADPGIEAGARLRAKGANVTLENTLYGRLEALTGELASEVSRVLLEARAT